MFKKGQLVRSKVTKRIFTVIDVEWNYSWMVLVKPEWVCLNKHPFLIRPEALELIGNNYQPKE